MNSIVGLIDLIEQRPAMYLGRNSISCLKAFIDGWYFRTDDQVVDSAYMQGFQDWIVKKYNIKSSHSWCDIILFHSQDEANALANFFKEFSEWRKIKDSTK